MSAPRAPRRAVAGLAALVFAAAGSPVAGAGELPAGDTDVGGTLFIDATHLDQTRNGKPVARVLPTAPAETIPSRAKLRRKMRRVKVGSEVLIREDRDARG